VDQTKGVMNDVDAENQLRDTLRAIPVLTGVAPEFDHTDVPDDPRAVLWP
jgi:hypothetical protein